MKKDLPQEIRNAILCEWVKTAAALVFRTLGKKSKCAKLMERDLYFDFVDVIECVMAIYRRQQFPNLSRLRAASRPAFFELSEFIESLDFRDAEYFLDAIERFKAKDLYF